MLKGRIIKGIAGFYYVDAEDGKMYACKARGIFRKEGFKPLAGDYVDMDVTDAKDMEGSITFVYKRKNALIRPPVANVDAALAILAAKDPVPDIRMLDRFIASMQKIDIPCIICINKMDLSGDEIRDYFLSYYGGTGIPICFVCAKSGDGIEELKSLIQGRVTTVAGPSGVGKSSVINRLIPGADLETGEVSRKIGRGKQTTRHSELLHIDGDTYIYDTPGFSSFELRLKEAIILRELYPEFRDYNDKCYFNMCTHIHEPECAVKEAVGLGRIDINRYKGYAELFEEASRGRK